jgi:hypothetical protein
MAVEQMVDFLPTWGLKVSRSQVYEYLGQMRLPRYYRRSEREQSHHDYFILRFFIRIAEDVFSAFGLYTRKLCKGTCIGCDKSDKECVVLQTESYTGPHCARCVMRDGPAEPGDHECPGQRSAGWGRRS